MNVSPSFLADLKYLAWFYKWTDDMKQRIKFAINESPAEFTHLFGVLATAHRNGYEGSGCAGLSVYCVENGLPYPYIGGLDGVSD